MIITIKISNLAINELISASYMVIFHTLYCYQKSKCNPGERELTILEERIEENVPLPIRAQNSEISDQELRARIRT